MPKENLTEEEQKAQTRLIAAWNKWRREGEGRTQTIVAEKLGLNQSTFGQYLNGRNPINLSFLFKICSIMKIDPKDIYPELFDDLDLTILKDVVPPELKALIDKAQKLSPDKLRLLRELSENLAGKQREDSGLPH